MHNNINFQFDEANSVLINAGNALVAPAIILYIPIAS